MHMNVDINALAGRLAHQVAAMNSEPRSEPELLDMAAALLGFKDYAAYQAEEARFTQSPFAMLQECVYATTLKDWEVNSGALPETEAPGYRKQAYQVLVSHQEGNTWVGVDVLPAGKQPDECDGLPMLSLNVEINDGLPCVRLYNTSFGDCLGTAYGHPEGLLIEEGNQSWSNATHLVEGHPLAVAVQSLNRHSKSDFIVVESSNTIEE